jgi:hypothetical protein
VTAAPRPQLRLIKGNGPPKGWRRTRNGTYTRGGGRVRFTVFWARQGGWMYVSHPTGYSGRTWATPEAAMRQVEDLLALVQTEIRKANARRIVEGTPPDEAEDSGPPEGF